MQCLPQVLAALAALSELGADWSPAAASAAAIVANSQTELVASPIVLILDEKSFVCPGKEYHRVTSTRFIQV